MSETLLMELRRVQALACVRLATAQTRDEYLTAAGTGAALARIAEWCGDAKAATLGGMVREYASHRAGVM